MAMVALLISLFLIWVASYVSVSWLIKIEYDSHRDSWEADGQPSDYFGYVSSKWAPRMFVSAAWVFSTPDWMERDQKALKLVAAYRLTFVLWILGLITLVVLMPRHR